MRDRAVLETLYSTGIRRHECISLSVEDLNPEKGLLLVRQGKGGKNRLVPVGERACLWLQRYYIESRPSLVGVPDTGCLFLTIHGQRMKSDTLIKIVRSYIRQWDHQTRLMSSVPAQHVGWHAG